MTVQSSFKTVRRTMLRIGPAMGEYAAISALAAQSVTASRLATGSVSTGVHAGKYLLRPESASQPADRERICSSFASSTGAFTHTGAAYGDTTVGTKTLEIHTYNPREVDFAIFTALPLCRFRDVAELPVYIGSTYWMGAFSWIRQPSDVIDIKAQGANILSKNRYLDKWNTVNSSGTFTPPDDWVVSGNAATVTLSTTQLWKRRSYSAALTRAGTDCLLTQTVGLLEDGIASGTTVRGQIVNAVFRVWCSVASRVRSWVSEDGGTTKTYSSYHSGGSTFEELKASATISTSASNLTFGLSLETGDTTVYVGEGFLTYGPVSDSQRADGNYPERVIYNRYGTQGGADMPLELPSLGIGWRYLISSQRPYPSFDETRMLAGTADSDVTFAPAHLVAAAAIYRLFDQKAQIKGQDTTKYERIRDIWKERYGNLQSKHLYLEGQQDHGDRIMSGIMGRDYGDKAMGPQDSGARRRSWRMYV